MKMLIASLLICGCCLVFPQNSLAQSGERLDRVDTVQVSPTLRKMIFKYFKNDDGYGPHSNKYSRFEVYALGDSLPFQTDTLGFIYSASYEDANFDNILDLKITTEANLNDPTDYYFYNVKSGKFEFGIGDLTNASANKKDSTIETSWECCAGTGGGGKELKMVNLQYIEIAESEFSREGYYEKKLIGDSLVYTRLRRLTDVGKNIFTDSSWDYLFGKLRIVQIEQKLRLDDASTAPLNLMESEIAGKDDRGRFIYISSENFEYSKNDEGKLHCSYERDVVRDGKWIVEIQTDWVVKD